MVPRFGFPLLFFLLLFSHFSNTESKCEKQCDLALASYYLSDQIGDLTNLSKIMKSPVLQNLEDILSCNTDTITNKDYIPTNTRVNVPFPCDCIDEGANLGYVFKYPIQKADTYTKIANQTYSNLTTDSSLQSRNGYSPNDIPDYVTLDVAVNCRCGDCHISKEYGLFITYPLRAEDSLDSLANQTKVDPELLRRYNPGADFNKGSGLVYIPGKGQNGVEVPMPPSTKGLKGGAIAGISAGAAVVVLLSSCMCVVYYQKKKEEEVKLLSGELAVYSSQHGKESCNKNDGVTKIKRVSC